MSEPADRSLADEAAPVFCLVRIIIITIVIIIFITVEA